MQNPSSFKPITNPKKLHHSKWTAVTPMHKEKHFIVTKLIAPELAASPDTLIELEAIHSKRTQIIPWQALNDGARWRQGWV